jgi:hypothetical protein
VQKTGPDGCLYILDWYDRYHCYQDANADPEGIDRAKGRLYRVVYDETGRQPVEDVGSKTDEELVEMLTHPNVFYRKTAQRLLSERDNASTAERLHAIVLDQDRPRQDRLCALFAWAGMSGDDRASMSLAGYENDKIDIAIRPWCTKLMLSDPDVRTFIAKNIDHQRGDQVGRWLTRSDEFDDAATHLQLAIGYAKLDHQDVVRILVHRLAKCGDDPLIPHIIWQNLHPLLKDHSDEFLKIVKEYNLKEHPNLAKIMPRVTEVILDQKDDQ